LTKFKTIVEYLVDNYDTEHKLHTDSFEQKYLEKQFLFFQVSGQGPYFGQIVYFSYFHHEDVPSVRERFLKEMDRVTGVLDAVLKDKPYLTGDRICYADLCWLPWYWGSERMDKFREGIFDKLLQKYPHFAKWYRNLMEREAVKKTHTLAEEAVAKYAKVEQSSTLSKE